MKLSIIIPVYKVELYIEKCLKSIVLQELDNLEYEIICINDGSPDNSKAIILEFQKKHSNIIFIDQENQGVSVARNKGLDVATGDYVLFIDPDDTIEPNSLKNILEKADKIKSDILYLDLCTYNEEDKLLYTCDIVGNKNVVLDGFNHPRRTFTANLYSRKTIGEIRYIANIPRGQDTVFNTMVQSKAKRVSCFSLPYYRYLIRGSSSRQFIGNDNVFNGCLLAISKLKEFKENNFSNPTEPQNFYFETVILTFIQRTLEWNILPTLNKMRFHKLKLFLHENSLDYLISKTAVQFRYFDKNFLSFYFYNKLKRFYYDNLIILSKIKRNISNG